MTLILVFPSVFLQDVHIFMFQTGIFGCEPLVTGFNHFHALY